MYSGYRSWGSIGTLHLIVLHPLPFVPSYQDRAIDLFNKRLVDQDRVMAGRSRYLRVHRASGTINQDVTFDFKNVQVPLDKSNSSRQVTAL